MKKERILSVCIASYNKAQTTYDLVVSLLSNVDEGFEVVVVDNASTDNTIELLETVKDGRLRIIKNEQNIGGAANMIKAVYSGNALFSLYTNDRDCVFPEKLSEFVCFLRSNQNITGGWCVRHDISEKEGLYTIYESKEALRKVCYRCEHPTGFFYNRNCLENIPVERLKTYVQNDLYIPFPWENLQTEVACMGNWVVYNKSIWKSSGNTSHKKYISSYVELGDAEDRWFSPQNCIERAKANVDNLLQLIKVNSIVLSDDELNKCLCNIFVFQQRIGAWRYKEILETESLAYHYAVKMKKVSYKDIEQISAEMKTTFIAYIREYCKNVDEFQRLLDFNIKNSNKVMIKRNCIGKVSRFLKKLKGKK